MINARTLFPQEDPEFFYVSDYQPILDSFGKIILQIDDADWQGDSRVLYKRGEHIGYLQFGWGSCSGCDALQACATYDKVDAVIQHLSGAISWFSSAANALTFFTCHDWEGDYSWHAEEQKEFIRKSIELLKGELKR